MLQVSFVIVLWMKFCMEGLSYDSSVAGRSLCLIVGVGTSKNHKQKYEVCLLLDISWDTNA